MTFHFLSSHLIVRSVIYRCSSVSQEERQSAKLTHTHIYICALPREVLVWLKVCVFAFKYI